MAEPLIVPDLGTETQELRISAWFVEPGDWIDAGDAALEVLMSGVTCEINAQVAGRVGAIEKPLDAVIHAGDVVAWIEPGPVDV